VEEAAAAAAGEASISEIASRSGFTEEEVKWRRSVQRVLRRFVRRAEYGRANAAAHNNAAAFSGITAAAYSTAAGVMARGGQFLSGMAYFHAGVSPTFSAPLAAPLRTPVPL